MGDVFLSIAGVRPSSQMLTTAVLHMLISFASLRDGRGTQGWVFSVSPAYEFLNLSCPWVPSA
jgi:hypothetical protein